MLFIPSSLFKLPFGVIFFQHFSISCKAVLLEMNYLTFYLCMTVFVSPLFLKDGYTLLTVLFFPSSTLNMLFLCLLASIVADDKSAINHFVVPWCAMSHFSPAAFKIFFFDFMD